MQTSRAFDAALDQCSTALGRVDGPRHRRDARGVSASARLIALAWAPDRSVPDLASPSGKAVGRMWPHCIPENAAGADSG